VLSLKKKNSENKWIFEKNGDIFLKVHVIPNVKKISDNQRFLVSENGIEIRLQAVPKGGQANRELIEVLAKKLGVKKRDIEIIKGEKARTKILRIRNIDITTIQKVLGL